MSQSSPEVTEFLNHDSDVKTPKKITKTGWALLGVSGALFVGVYAVTAPFVSPALRKICLPYVPATTRQVKNVMTMLQGRTGRLVDLGSGDGRIVMEAARAGYHAEGIELNAWLVWYSRLMSRRLGLHSTTGFHRKDLWKSDLTPYPNIVIFGVEQMMAQLEEKLEKELCADGQVIACRFPLPTWQPVQTIEAGIDTVWLYKRPLGGHIENHL